MAIGKIAYGWQTGDLFIVNTWNSNSGDIIFKTKEAGTAVTPLTIEGSGNILMPNLQNSVSTVDVCMIASTGELTEDSSTSCTTSSRSVKNTIEPMEYGLKEVLQFKPSQFYYNWDNETRHNGLIADEVYEIAPNLVHFDNGKIDTLYFDDMHGLSFKAIQEQQEIIENQQRQIDNLNTRLTALESRK